MERADESDVVRPAAGIAGELHGALDRLCAGVGEEHLRRCAGQDSRLEALRQLDLRAVVEIRPRHMQESVRLLLDRGHHPRMGVAGGDDGDASREVEEAVAVDIRDPAARAVIHHEGVRAREAGRHRLGVAGDQIGGLRSRQRRLDVGPHGRQA